MALNSCLYLLSAEKQMFTTIYSLWYFLLFYFYSILLFYHFISDSFYFCIFSLTNLLSISSVDLPCLTHHFCFGTSNLSHFNISTWVFLLSLCGFAWHPGLLQAHNPSLSVYQGRELQCTSQCLVFT